MEGNCWFPDETHRHAIEKFVAPAEHLSNWHRGIGFDNLVRVADRPNQRRPYPLPHHRVAHSIATKVEAEAAAGTAEEEAEVMEEVVEAMAAMEEEVEVAEVMREEAAGT